MNDSTRFFSFFLLRCVGIHPSVIADAFLYAQAKACEVARSISQPVDLANRNSLIAAAVTSLNSKVRTLSFRTLLCSAF
jgi:chaperonin GroEL (HSP60 family)